MMSKKRGFTLVELMIVVAILGVLAAIAIPMYRGYVLTSKRSEAKSNLETIRLLQEQYYADHKKYVEATGGTADLISKLPGFQPGDPSKLYYNYFVNYKNSNNQTFIATAQPKSSSLGSNLTIDENNNKSW